MIVYVIAVVIFIMFKRRRKRKERIRQQFLLPPATMPPGKILNIELFIVQFIVTWSHYRTNKIKWKLINLYLITIKCYLANKMRYLTCVANMNKIMFQLTFTKSFLRPVPSVIKFMYIIYKLREKNFSWTIDQKNKFVNTQNYMNCIFYFVCKLHT